MAHHVELTFIQTIVDAEHNTYLTHSYQPHEEDTILAGTLMAISDLADMPIVTIYNLYT